MDEIRFVAPHPASVKLDVAWEDFIENDTSSERLLDAVIDVKSALVPPQVFAKAAELIRTAIEAMEHPSAGRQVEATKALKEVENFLLDEVERANEQNS